MDNTPIFWNTQGSITYDTEKNYFNYETSMSVNWNNKKARRVLITLMKLFNRPEILNVNTNGIAIWTYNNLKNNIFYKKPNIFYEIIPIFYTFFIIMITITKKGIFFFI